MRVKKYGGFPTSSKKEWALPQGQNLEVQTKSRAAPLTQSPQENKNPGEESKLPFPTAESVSSVDKGNNQTKDDLWTCMDLLAMHRHARSCLQGPDLHMSSSLSHILTGRY